MPELNFNEDNMRYCLQPDVSKKLVFTELIPLSEYVNYVRIEILFLRNKKQTDGLFHRYDLDIEYIDLGNYFSAGPSGVIKFCRDNADCLSFPIPDACDEIFIESNMEEEFILKVELQ